MAKPKSPKPPSGGSKGKKPKGKAKTVIRTALASKIEELVRTSKLDMLLQRRNLGLESKGDMNEFVKDLIKKLKSKVK